MQTMQEHYRGATLDEARSEATADIDAMRPHGWTFTRIKTGRDADGFFVDVTYAKGEADE